MEVWIGIPYLKKRIQKLNSGCIDYDAALNDVLNIIKKYERSKCKW